MKAGSILLLTLAALIPLGCTCRRATVTPRAPVSVASDAPWRLLEVAEAHAPEAETLQMQGEITISGDEILGRWGFTGVVHWRMPGDVRLLLNRPPPVTLMQFAQRDEWLTVFFEQDRRCFQGPVSSLDEQVRRRVPVADARALVAVPLIDDIFVDRLPDLSLTERPEGSCWRRHIFFRGDPGTSTDRWWQQFEEEVWAVRRETLTVEGVALRLPSGEAAEPLWLWAAFDEYAPFDAAGEGDRAEEGLILPSVFQLSLVRRPWKRWWRGEVWRIDGRISRIRLNRTLRDQIFEIRIPRGAEILALRQLAL